MSKPTLIINELDAERLDTLLAQPAFANSPVADALNEELDRAEILPPEQIPADVVTMNSKVRRRRTHPHAGVSGCAQRQQRATVGDGAVRCRPAGAARRRKHHVGNAKWREQPD